MIYSNEYQFVYLAPKKTGTSSIHRVLKEHFAARTQSSLNGKSRRHLTDIPEEFSDCFIFASVRNPFYRAISCFKDQTYRIACNLNRKQPRITNASFNKWIENLPIEQSLHRQLRMHQSYRPPPGCIRYKINAIVRLEHLNEDFAKLPFIENEIKFEHINPISDYFNRNPSLSKKLHYYPTCAAIFVNRFGLDFESFGYSKTIPSSLLPKAFV